MGDIDTVAVAKRNSCSAISCCSPGVGAFVAMDLFNVATGWAGLLRYYHQEAA